MPKASADRSSGRSASGAIREINPQIAMKRIITLLFIAFASLVLGADAVPPNKYSLSVARVHESKPERPEWVFIFFGTSATRGGETVCRSPETLKKLLKGLPRASTLDRWPTCDGDSEALGDHLDDLKKICTEAGIVFTIHSAG